MNDLTLNLVGGRDEGAWYRRPYHCYYRKLIGLALIACGIVVSIAAALVTSQKGYSRGDESIHFLKGKKLLTVSLTSTNNFFLRFPCLLL